jgi:hypothetical protein
MELLLIVVIGYSLYSVYNYSPIISKRDKIEYMKSDKWNAKRELVLKRDCYKCCSCNRWDRYYCDCYRRFRLSSKLNINIIFKWWKWW